MTVRELKNKLEEFPEDSNVYITDYVQGYIMLNKNAVRFVHKTNLSKQDYKKTDVLETEYTCFIG